MCTPQELLALLRVSSSSPRQVQAIHQRIIALGLLQSSHIFCKKLVDSYASLHLTEPARLVLESTSSDAFQLPLWNGLLSFCSKNRMYAEALLVFERLRLCCPAHLKPDEYSYPSAIKACGATGDAVLGREIHALVVKSGFLTDVVVSSSAVAMYAKCGSFDAAVRLFGEIPVRDVPCWNTVISCYYQDGRPSKALELFDVMRRSGFEPDSVTYTTVFSACARLSDLEFGRKVHEDLIARGFQLDGFISAALVDMYGKCGCLDGAREVFEQIEVKSVVSWNTIIGGYASGGDSSACLELLSRMHRQGVRPTSTTVSSLLAACSRSSNIKRGKFVHGYMLRNRIETDIYMHSALVDLYFKCGRVNCAESVFEEMPKSNVVSWNVMVSGYVSVGCYFKALDYFHGMRDHCVRPDAVSFASVLSACSQLAALEQGREIHIYIAESGLESSEIVMCALLDMYAKCGTVEEASQVFHRLPTKDIVSWTSMIMAYGSNGQAREALNLFHELQKAKERPDLVAFLAVLSACVHGGLVDEGCYYFDQMRLDNGIEPRVEHFSCLIDLLGRAGRLEEAYGILVNNPSIKSDAGILTSLFSACSLHKNFHLGQKIAKLLVDLNPDDHSTYIALANMYASSGRWADVRKVRTQMKERGLKKNPGCSWIEVDKRIHQFFVEDDSHPLEELIYNCLRSLARHMKKDKSLHM